MNNQGFRITNKGRAALIAMKENAKQDEETPAHYRIADALAEAGLLAPDLPEAKEMDEELAPLPKPKDCKEEDVYRAKMDYNGQRGFGVSVRCNPEDFYTPWSVTLDDGDHWWVDDSAVTLLARLLPDREVQA